MSSFTAAITAFVQVAKRLASESVSLNQKAAQAVAIGWLEKKSQRDINNAARTEGDFSDDAWKVVKVPLSQAWRAIAGEYGFGEDLALMWAKGDFSISLNAAYKASKPPVDPEQLIEQLVKQLLTLNDEDRDTVISRVAIKLNAAKENDARRPERFASLTQNAVVAK